MNRRRGAAAALAAGLLLGACGAEGGSPVVEADSDDVAADTSTSTTAAPDPLVVLVSNDDGYAAPGIAALVDALDAVEPEVEVVVVAPDGNRSGSGGQTTPGGTTGTEVTMANGHPAVAVTGFPADAVAHALDVLGVEPDVVISGINEGQNLGPVADLSGTVGAARAAAQRGIPAVAVSAGFGTPAPDYAAGVDAVMDWFAEHRDDLEAATADQVVNINVPTCAAGELRDVVEVTAATDAAGRDVLAADVDCSGTGPAPVDDPTFDDVAAFNAGFGVIAVVPAAPG